MVPKADARPAADVLRELASTSICSSSTTARLQDLLSTAPKPASKPSDENVKPKTARSAATTATRTQRAIAESKTRTKAKAPITVEIHEDIQPQLSPREKYILATETINTTLKTLGDALKPQPRTHKRVSSARNEPSTGIEGARTTSKRTSLTRTNSYQQRPLQPRSVSQLSNSEVPTKRSAFRRSSSYSVSSRQGPPPGITATAECARLAFGYLRTPEAAKVAGKNLPALQLESGMLALVGKLIAHGLESMAVKELRILKRRLEAYMAGEGKDSKSNKAGIITEKESLASLLEFEHLDLDSPALPLLISHQTYVLKVAASSRRPATIEAALSHLQFSSPSSPGNLCLAYVKRPGCEAKAARQLEVFAQILLSLCPSIAASEDVLACNSKLKPSPEVAFQLQQIAFELRSSLSAKEKYQLAVELFKRLEESVRFAEKDKFGDGKDLAFGGRTSIYHSLSSLAQSGGLRKEALLWMTKTSQAYKTASASEVKHAGIAVRLAALTLEDSSLSNTTDSSSLLERAREHLTGSLKGDSAELDLLFGEVAGLRKAATKQILQTSKDATDPGDSGFCASLFSVIAASTNFVARYIGTRPRPEADPKAVIRHANRIVAARKVLKSFVDSVVVSCKAMIAAGTSSFEAIDSMLHDLSLVINEVCDCSAAGNGEANMFHEGLGWPLVKVSNTYWILFLRLKKSESESKRVLRFLKNASDVLSGRSPMEKELGSLGMKLGKLGETYEAANHFARATEAFKAAITTLIETGALRDAAAAGKSRSLQDVWNEPGALGHLGHSLRALQKIAARHLDTKSAEPMVYDNERLIPEERGMILEYQLNFCSETLVKLRTAKYVAAATVQVLADRLFPIYPVAQFPLRRQRVAVTLLRIAADQPGLLSSEVLETATQSCTPVCNAVEEDAGLCGYREHLQATATVCLAFRDTPPNLEALKAGLRTWQTILDAAYTGSALTAAVDDVAAWITQLRTISEYLEVRGLHFLRVPVLEMLGKVLELQEPPMVSRLVETLSRLGLQYLRLGYSGKAGLALAKAQNLLTEKELSTETRLQWHLAYAEYLLRIGNAEKCTETLQTAEELASHDAEVLRATQPSATLSSRIGYNRLLSDACYIQSLLSFETGAYETALVCARRCHRLNQRVWANLENCATRQARTSPNEVAESEVDSLVEGMSRLMAPTASNPPPPTMSMTHESLSGARFWALVPALFRGLIHLTRLLTHMGMLQEAVCFAEQAHRVAVAAHSDALTVQVLTIAADLWLSSGRLDKGSEYLGKAAGLSKTIEMGQVVVNYKQSMAMAHRLLDEKEEELTVYDEAISIVQRLVSPHFIHSLSRIPFDEPTGDLEKRMEKLSLAAPEEPRRRTVKTATKAVVTKKSTVKTPARTNRKDATKSVQGSVPSTADECPGLLNVYGEIIRRKATALLLEDKLSDAAGLIAQAEELCHGHGSLVQQQLVVFRSATQHGLKAMAADFTYNVLPESTISFPAVAQALRKLSEPAGIRPLHLTPPKKRAGRSPSPRKG
ncbi:separin protein [Coniosporium tulheliwenetii]|uniref:Separin protein n=1 Tax=Coniosporium tulheliwenetii TaxID=3383036 RepID=A0ACC2Z785_9PEZI|nr:separin protein [Cladosporium sp. JES 115]